MSPLIFLACEVTLDALVLNEVEFTCGERLVKYERVLGSPTRSLMPGPPPPYGHRNNVLHFYDHLGLLLREHHFSYVIEEIEVVLDPSASPFPTASPYSGDLLVCGVDVTAGMAFGEFARRSTVKFKPHLGHAWYVDGDKISIQFEVTPSRKSAPAVELIWGIAIGFAGAHVRNQPAIITDALGR
ncbi:MAG: hypothetical protein L0Y71_07725 [Gemmataceae bacterium]|nr:hypothetical protein [Gemmataceae bacterium]